MSIVKVILCLLIRFFLTSSDGRLAPWMDAATASATAEMSLFFVPGHVRRFHSSECLEASSGVSSLETSSLFVSVSGLSRNLISIRRLSSVSSSSFSPSTYSTIVKLTLSIQTAVDTPVYLVLGWD